MSPIIEAMKPSPNSDRQSCASLGELFPKNGTAFATESPTTFVSSRPTIFGSSRRPGISRFPTDTAILAEEDQHNLTVEFLERVFMKSATSYKAAAYQDVSLAAGFWLGRAVDRQIDSGTAEYWIFEFLASGFRLTSAAGTRRLGTALRDAIRKSDDVIVKSEIAAAVTLASGLRGRQISVREFENQFRLSDAARDAIERELKHPGLAQERFRFDAEEFRSQVAYRSVELSNGAMLTSESSEFDDVFQREVLDEATQEVRFSTAGGVIGENLTKKGQRKKGQTK